MTDLFDDPSFKDFLREYFMNEVESERNKAMDEIKAYHVVTSAEDTPYVASPLGDALLYLESEKVAELVADRLNLETSFLHEEIARLKAEKAHLADECANQYAELVELRKTAQALAELEDIAADLADNLPSESE